LHDPPGDNNAFQVHPDAPEELKREELEFATLDPETNIWVCIAVLVVAVGVMAYTAEIVSCPLRQVTVGTSTDLENL
jgi:Ca2+:H+ antiporter